MSQRILHENFGLQQLLGAERQYINAGRFGGGSRALCVSTPPNQSRRQAEMRERTAQRWREVHALVAQFPLPQRARGTPWSRTESDALCLMHAAHAKGRLGAMSKSLFLSHAARMLGRTQRSIRSQFGRLCRIEEIRSACT